MNYLNLFTVLSFLVCSTVISAQKKNVIITQNTGEKVQKDIRKKSHSFYFTQFGIMSKNHTDFKNKYCVDVLYENCVISPLQSEKAKKNNREVAKYLTEKYGESWKNDLGFVPYGL